MYSLIAALTVLASAAAPIPKDSRPSNPLVGTWVLTKSGQLPVGVTATIEIAAAGEFTMTVNIGDQKLMMAGTWKLDGDKLTVTVKGPDGKEKPETMTIKRLDSTELITVDERGQQDEFKREK